MPKLVVFALSMLILFLVWFDYAQASNISLINIGVEPNINIFTFNFDGSSSPSSKASDLLAVGYSETQTSAQLSVSPLFDLDDSKKLNLKLGAGQWEFDLTFDFQDLVGDDQLTVTGTKLQHITGKTLNGLGVPGDFPHPGDAPVGTLTSFIFPTVNAEGNNGTEHRELFQNVLHPSVGHRDQYTEMLDVNVDTNDDEIRGWKFSLDAIHVNTTIPEPSTLTYLVLALPSMWVVRKTAKLKGQGG